METSIFVGKHLPKCDIRFKYQKYWEVATENNLCVSVLFFTLCTLQMSPWPLGEVCALCPSGGKSVRGAFGWAVWSAAERAGSALSSP